MIALRRPVPRAEPGSGQGPAPRAIGRAALRGGLRGHAGALRAARALERRVSSVRSLGPLRPRLVVGANPRIELEEVGRALAWRPSLRLAVAALVLALGLHLGLGSWSLALHPHKAKAARVEMAVLAAAEQVEELPPEDAPAPPPPEPEPASSSRDAAVAASPAPAAPSLAPGPIVPGLSPVAGAGGGLGVAVGGGNQAGPASSGAARGAPSSTPKVDAPRPQRRASPEYPRRARERGVEGFVSLHILVDETGAVRDVRVLDAQPRGVFEEAAVAAVRRWSFSPGRTDGAATEAWVRQVVRFALD